MLDAASLIVDAVYVTFPASVKQRLLDRPNPRSNDGTYKPMKRYQQDFYRKHLVALTCRSYWRPVRDRGCSNRNPEEPCHRHLTPELVGLCVRRLLEEFRRRQNAFCSPLPSFHTPEADYEIWEREAIHGVKDMLNIEVELARAIGLQG